MTIVERKHKIGLLKLHIAEEYISLTELFTYLSVRGVGAKFNSVDGVLEYLDRKSHEWKRVGVWHQFLPLDKQPDDTIENLKKLLAL